MLTLGKDIHRQLLFRSEAPLQWQYLFQFRLILFKGVCIFTVGPFD